MADGALVSAFVYAPAGVTDEPGTPFAVTWDPAPAVVLHGNGESHEHMLGVVGPLARERSVIAVDSRGQGVSTRGSEPLTYELMAADVLEVMSRLGVTQAHVLGFSDGGIVALLVALTAPWRVLSLSALGANLEPEGLADEAREEMRSALAAMRADGAAAGAATTAAGARYRGDELLGLMLTQPHVDPERLRVLTCPALVMAGECDLIKPEETRRIAGALGSSRLVIVPGAGHDLPAEVPARVADEAARTMEAGRRPRPLRPLVSFSKTNEPQVNDPSSADVVVVRASEAQEGSVQALYERLLDSCASGRETCGWRRGYWPLPDDVARRLRAGETWVVVDAADVTGGGPGTGAKRGACGATARSGARILGVMSLDFDFGLPGVDVGWEELAEGEALTCHLLAVDPAARGRGVATALLAEYAREGLSRGCRALRINTSPQSLSNRLYHELGFIAYRPVLFPYEGLPLTPWTCVYELPLVR